MTITKKQKHVYDYIVQYFQLNGYSPTQDEIKLHFGLKSLGSVQKYIQYLTNAGYLKSSWNARRGLEPLSSPHDSSSKDDFSFQIPLFGKVAAGRPIDIVEQSEAISVPPSMFHKNHFALQVEGQSMIDDGIFEDDIIVVKKSSTANNGQTIVAIIENAATVKKYYFRKGVVELHPANSSMSPFVINKGDFSIAGIVVGLMRQF